MKTQEIKYFRDMNEFMKKHHEKIINIWFELEYNIDDSINLLIKELDEFVVNEDMKIGIFYIIFHAYFLDRLEKILDACPNNTFVEKMIDDYSKMFQKVQNKR